MGKEVLCCCHEVTLDDVKKQISRGVVTFEELQKNTGIGTDCPPCKEQNEVLFNQLVDDSRNT